MKKKSVLKIFAVIYILFCAAMLLSVSLMAFDNPQSVMDLVKVNLNSTDAFSSIRGVYGGVSLTLVLSLIYLVRKNIPLALLFLTFFWGSYAFSRTLTILTEGALGSFGQNWLIIESTLGLIAMVLYFSVRFNNLQYQNC